MLEHLHFLDTFLAGPDDGHHSPACLSVSVVRENGQTNGQDGCEVLCMRKGLDGI